MVGEIFFIDYKTVWSEKNFKFLKSLYPFVRKIDAHYILEDIFKIAAAQSITNQFWVIDGSVRLLPSFKFDADISKWDQQYIHSFNILVNWKLRQEGVYLLTKKFKNEYKNFNKLVGYDNSNFDIVFISYNEKNADTNYEKLKLKTGREILRVHGVKGIHNAHLEAARIATTPMFWVVDADAKIVKNFNFKYKPKKWDMDVVHIWRSSNPINGLKYGYGGVKLLPRKQVLEMNLNSVDMTTSISTKIKIMPNVSNITAFNTDPFTTWRSAFRECCKLAVINNEESLSRLDSWSQLNNNAPYGAYAYFGALAGKIYGEKNAADPAALSLINDFEWLNEQYQQSQQLMEKSL